MLSKTAALVVSALLLAASVPGHAEPAADAAMQQLLHDKGLLAATDAAVKGQPLTRQMSDAASELVGSAMNFLGVRYRRGGNSVEQGFDCSGFTRYIFENSVGLVLPRRADQQAKQDGLTPVKKEELQPGDLVFFNTMRRAFSHVGIYVGEGKFIHAPRAGGKVRVEDIHTAYWTKRFNGARRADIDGAQAEPVLR